MRMDIPTLTKSCHSAVVERISILCDIDQSSKRVRATSSVSGIFVVKILKCLNVSSLVSG